MAQPNDPVDSFDAPVGDKPHGSLRGTFVAVLLMAIFFAVTWFGMLALAWSRR